MPMQLRIVTMVAVSVVAVCQLGAQTVTPKFAWPAGASATMVMETHSKTTGGAGGMDTSDSSATRVTFDYAILAHPEGLEVVQGRGVVERLVPSSRPQPADVVGMSALGARYIIAKDGKFVRLSDMAEQKRRMDSVMAPVVEQVRQTAPAMLPTIERSSSPEAITAMMQQAHDGAYAILYNRSWTKGDSVTTSVSMPSPISPTTPMVIPRVLRFDGVVACPDTTRRTCWQFTSRLVISRETMRPALVEMLKTMGMPESMIDQVPVSESTATTTNVVDASTMLPLRVEQKTIGSGSSSMVSMQTNSSIITTYRWK